MRYVEAAMGIPMSVDIRDAGDHAGAVRAAFDLIAAADHRFSTYRDDSEVSAVNRGLVGPCGYSDELRQVLAIGDAAERASRGAFRVRLGCPPVSVLDTNGVVKGWAVQQAADLLTDAGVRDFCFNAGGDVVVRGVPTAGALWNVAVRSPWDARAVLAVLAVTDCAVATSGNYERGNHIVDGRTGRPALELTSATVVASSLTTADVLATAVFALGRDGAEWAIKNGADAALVVTRHDDILIAGSLPLASQ